MSVRWSEAGPVSELLAQWSLTVSSMSGEASNSLTWVSDSAGVRAPRHIVADQLEGWLEEVHIQRALRPSVAGGVEAGQPATAPLFCSNKPDLEFLLATTGLKVSFMKTLS